MIINIDVFSLKNNEIIYSNFAKINEEISLDIFTFKILSLEKIVICVQDKKFIVYMNEIFSINHSKYVILKKNNLLNLISISSPETRFDYLEQGRISLLFLSIIKNIFSIKISIGKSNFYFVKKFLLFIFVFSFLLKNQTISTEGISNENEFLTQKNLYAILNDISSQARPEVLLAEVKPSISLLEPIKKIENKKRKFNVKKKIEVFDSEIQYFLQLKKKK